LLAGPVLYANRFYRWIRYLESNAITHRQMLVDSVFTGQQRDLYLVGKSCASCHRTIGFGVKCGNEQCVSVVTNYTEKFAYGFNRELGI
jgi:aspartate carbamoyltransferase regulatory subunit